MCYMEVRSDVAIKIVSRYLQSGLYAESHDFGMKLGNIARQSIVRCCADFSPLNFGRIGALIFPNTC